MIHIFFGFFLYLLNPFNIFWIPLISFKSLWSSHPMVMLLFFCVKENWCLQFLIALSLNCNFCFIRNISECAFKRNNSIIFPRIKKLKNNGFMGTLIFFFKLRGTELSFKTNFKRNRYSITINTCKWVRWSCLYKYQCYLMIYLSKKFIFDVENRNTFPVTSRSNLLSKGGWYYYNGYLQIW